MYNLKDHTFYNFYLRLDDCLKALFKNTFYVILGYLSRKRIKNVF